MTQNCQDAQVNSNHANHKSIQPLHLLTTMKICACLHFITLMWSVLPFVSFTVLITHFTIIAEAIIKSVDRIIAL